MAKDSAKKPLPNAADVPSAAPLVAKVERAKARLAKVATASGDGGASPDGTRVRGARKRVKRAQRRLRRELRRAVVTAVPAGDAAPAEADAG